MLPSTPLAVFSAAKGADAGLKWGRSMHMAITQAPTTDGGRQVQNPLEESTTMGSGVGWLSSSSQSLTRILTWGWYFDSPSY